MIELCNIRNELPRNGITRIIAVDQLRQGVRNRERVAINDFLERRQTLLCHQTARAELGGAA